MTVRCLLVFCPDDPLQTIYTVPALQTLRKAFPDSMLVMFEAQPDYKGVMRPFVNTVEEMEGDEDRRIAQIRRFRPECALVFTTPGQSPFSQAYRCYRAGVPIRIAISDEFGGGVLSHWIRPPLPYLHPVHRHLLLPAALGIDSNQRG